MKKAFLLIVSLVSIQYFCMAQEAYSDTTFIAVDSLKITQPAPLSLFPNIGGKAMMTPTAWGGFETFVFGSIGGTFPQTYAINPDLIASVGFGTGNSYKTLGIIAIVDINDVSEIDNFTLSLIASRTLSIGNSVSIGAIHLFANRVKSDMGASYYVAYSHAVQSMPSKFVGCAKLNYTIGIGTGRFYDKSYYDKIAGRGEHGTALFANISYEVLPLLNLGLEWSGLNLCSSLSWRPAINLPSVSIGVADLTRLSGDRARLLTGISYAYIIRNKKDK